jgi:hypothetical protein
MPTAFAAQHSVHLIPGKERRGRGGGTRRVSKHFAGLEFGSGKVAWSRPPTSTPERLVIDMRGLTGHST